MTNDERGPQGSGPHAGYIQDQLRKALMLATKAEAPASLRERALRRVAAWRGVIERVADGRLQVGSRTPAREVPAWATLEVVKGGFATGALMAGGDLQPHEKALLARLGLEEGADSRMALNAHYLSEAGLIELLALFESGCYRVSVPEEGALLVLVWLLHGDQTEDAGRLLQAIYPWLQKLRFYPVPAPNSLALDDRVALQDVSTAIDQLRAVRLPRQLQVQTEVVEVWMPFWDRLIALFIETINGEVPTLQCRDGRWERLPNGAFPVQGAWPCQNYADDWHVRAAALLREYEMLRREHPRSSRPDRAKRPMSQLLGHLRTCVRDPALLRGRDVGQIRLIIACYVTKHGLPSSASLHSLRAAQLRQCTGPSSKDLADLLIQRLIEQGVNQLDSGLEDSIHLLDPVTQGEAVAGHVPFGAVMPSSIARRVRRCVRAPIDELAEQGLLRSGEALAKVVPQISGKIAAASLETEPLRRLYGLTYAAFRKRRSLLLLNLQSQVQLKELPWVAAMELGRSVDPEASRHEARKTLSNLVGLCLVRFPQAIVPNKLLQELRALGDAAGMEMLLVDEVAADIFMGEFTSKYALAAQQAARILKSSLYETYYGIDCEALLALPIESPSGQPSAFARLCAARAGAQLGGWSPAVNGTVIEQQQILTTQNLAVLCLRLGLQQSLRESFPMLAQHCFAWICKRLQTKCTDWHGRLIHIKNAAYAWRQMVFYLACASPSETMRFCGWAREHLREQALEFQLRFEPALLGLERAVHDRLPADNPTAGTRCFLGWSSSRHWLLERSTEPVAR